MDIGNTVVRGSFSQTSNSGIRVGQGTTAERPANAAGLIRYNTTLSRLELNDGSAWANIGSGDGSVTSVGLTGVDGAITVGGSPITGSGTFTLALAGELAGINAITTTGLVTRTTAGEYTTRSVSANTANGTQGISVSNGDGVSGAPTIGLDIVGLNASGALSNTATFIINDGSNNLKATLAQLLTLVDSGFVLQTGDTMTGPLILSADPDTALAASTKSYVDNAAAFAAGTGLTLTGKTFSVNTSGVSTGIVSNNIVIRSTGTVGQILRSVGVAGNEASWGALDLAQANSITGVLPIANGGTGANTAIQARTNLGVPSIYRLAFTNANLVANALTVFHNLGQQFVSITVSDNSNKVIIPDDITLSNSTSLVVDFTSFGALTGTWNVVVVG
jgi:hypothetical protein